MIVATLPDRSETEMLKSNIVIPTRMMPKGGGTKPQKNKFKGDSLTNCHRNEDSVYENWSMLEL